ncbi:MATE family efflux transporter [Streptococcus sp. DD13]|uniref:MATE family efflux transporter n=1 Tax=Streptococcus sp. DD13 TaxID=1777881 RepID=UPI000796CB80|nr:MATE family efflux transporter [Streptococcus sp. DD13]KXT78247.1 Na+ driven multidrug efflux pump [Streptococcus sp. DD13]
MRLGQVLYFSLIVSMGSKTFAAHTIAGTIESFTYMPAYGLATAVSVLVGMSVGEHKPCQALSYTVKASACGVFLMSLLGLVLWILAPDLTQLFTTDTSASAQTITALHIAAINQPVLALSLILPAALQGAGDTKTPLVTTLLGMWGIRVLGIWILGQVSGWGIRGIWIAIGIDLTLRSLFLANRFFQKVHTLERNPKHEIL